MADTASILFDLLHIVSALITNNVADHACPISSHALLVVLTYFFLLTTSKIVPP